MDVLNFREIILRETLPNKKYRYLIDSNPPRYLTAHENRTAYKTHVKVFNRMARHSVLFPRACTKNKNKNKNENEKWTFHTVLDRTFDRKRKQYLYLVQWCTIKKTSQSWILRDHADDANAIAMLDRFDVLFRF